MKRLILVSILALLPGCMPPDYTKEDQEVIHIEKEQDAGDFINWKRA